MGDATPKVEAPHIMYGECVGRKITAYMIAHMVLTRIVRVSCSLNP